jgi:hypothetical protein
MLENAKKEKYCLCINEVFQHFEYMHINLEIEKPFFFGSMYVYWYICSKHSTIGR